MSEFSSSAPLRDDRGPTWILLFLAGVMFQIKKELPSVPTHRLARTPTPQPLGGFRIAPSLTFTPRAGSKGCVLSTGWGCTATQTLGHQQNHIPWFCLFSSRGGQCQSHAGFTVPLQLWGSCQAEKVH